MKRLIKYFVNVRPNITKLTKGNDCVCVCAGVCIKYLTMGTFHIQEKIIYIHFYLQNYAAYYQLWLCITSLCVQFLTIINMHQQYLY